jgi:broad specificity phosphatase PhoE
MAFTPNLHTYYALFRPQTFYSFIAQSSSNIMESSSREIRQVNSRRTTLIFVRHAVAELQVGESGDAERPLSSRGLEQIPPLLESLQVYRVQYIYASDTRRAAQTANEIGKVLDLTVRLLPALRELGSNIGAKPGVGFEQAAQQESLQTFQLRISGAVDQIVTDCPEACTVVVAHSGTIRAALDHLLQLPLSAYELPSISQGSFVVVVKHFGGSWSATG